MTGREATGYIGRTGTLYVRAATFSEGPNGGPFKVCVKVLDAREVGGRVDLFVQAIAGTGAAWVEARRVHLDEPPATPKAD